MMGRERKGFFSLRKVNGKMNGRKKVLVVDTVFP